MKKIKKLSLKLYKNIIKYKTLEIKQKVYKSIFSDLRLSDIIRLKTYYILNSLNIRITKVFKFCIYTYQTKGIVKFVNMYRMIFRKNSSFAIFSGISKSSW